MLTSKRGCDAIVFQNLRFHLSTRIRESSVLKNFHFGRRFQEVAFSVTEKAGYVWMEGENGWKKLRFQKYPDTCGRARNYLKSNVLRRRPGTHKSGSVWIRSQTGTDRPHLNTRTPLSDPVWLH